MLEQQHPTTANKSEHSVQAHATLVGPNHVGPDQCWPTMFGAFVQATRPFEFTRGYKTGW